MLSGAFHVKGIPTLELLGLITLDLIQRDQVLRVLRNLTPCTDKHPRHSLSLEEILLLMSTRSKILIKTFESN